MCIESKRKFDRRIFRSTRYHKWSWHKKIKSAIYYGIYKLLSNAVSPTKRMGLFGINKLSHWQPLRRLSERKPLESRVTGSRISAARVFECPGPAVYSLDAGETWTVLGSFDRTVLIEEGFVA